MHLIIEYDSDEDLLNQIALFIERAASSERSFAKVASKTKTEAARSEYAAFQLDQLAATIRDIRIRRVRKTQPKE